MSEPPVSIDPEGVRAEPRRIGKRWTDLAVTATAIVMSLISLQVGLDNARTQEMMLAATSRPILFFTTGNRDNEGRPNITLVIRNDGAGPAFLKHLEVTYAGRSAKGGFDLLKMCCMTAEQVRRPDHDWLQLGTQRVGQTVRPAGDASTMIDMLRTEENKDVWERLNRARFQLKFDACYCSVLAECWRSDLSGLEPRQVDSCPSEGGYRE